MKYVIYCRVSTNKQGRSGLSLESQQNVCNSYVSSMNGEILNTFIEVESGKKRGRIELIKALELCRKEDAELVVAKLDRLARDVEFTFSIFNSGIKIYFCDFPQMNTFTLGVFAAYGQYEAELISKRTKAALKVAKDKGTLLGCNSPKYKEKINISEHLYNCRIKAAESKREMSENNENNKRAIAFISELKKSSSLTWYEIAEKLNKTGFKTSNGKEFTSGNAYNIYNRRK